MSPDKRVVITCIVVTNEPIEVYGGIRLSDTVLEQLAAELQLGNIPFQKHHDSLQRFSSKCLRAEVVDLGSGVRAVEADFEIEAQTLEDIQEEWKAAGVPGGISCSFSEALYPTQDAILKLAADAHYFEDSDIIEAAEIMSSLGTISPTRLYQFAALPPPHIVIDLTAALLCIPASVIATAVYDGLKYLLLKIRNHHKESETETQIDLFTRRKADGSFEQNLHICTSDAEVLKHAIDRLSEAIETEHTLLAWNEQSMDWDVFG